MCIVWKVCTLFRQIANLSVKVFFVVNVLTTSVSMSVSTTSTVRRCGTPVTGHGTSSVRVVIFSPSTFSVSRTINVPGFVLIAIRGKTMACWYMCGMMMLIWVRVYLYICCKESKMFTKFICIRSSLFMFDWILASVFYFLSGDAVGVLVCVCFIISLAYRMGLIVKWTAYKYGLKNGRSTY